MGDSNKGITSGDDKRSSKRSFPSLRCTYKSDFFLGSRNLGENRNKLTNPLGLGTLLNRNRLGWRNWSFGRSSLCNSRSRGHGFNHDICLIKKALHGHAHSSRNLLAHGVINRMGLRVSLKDKKGEKKKEKKKKERRMLRQKK